MEDSNSEQGKEEIPTSPVRKNIELFESKFGYKLKKGPAPPPPGKQIQLPKIGNFKPKNISTQRSVEKENVNPESKSDGFYFGEIVINEKSDNQQKADDNIVINKESSDTDNEIGQPKFTENPLFRKTELNIPLIEEDTSYGLGVDNPVFVSPPADYPVENDPIHSTEISDMPEPPPRKKRSSKGKQAPSPPTSTPEHQYISEDDRELPFIPEPDYEDDISSKPIQNGGPYSRHTLSDIDEGIYKEYEGEDYSKYLSDEDDSGFYETFTGRGKVKYRRKNLKKSQAPPPPRPQSVGPMKPVKNNVKRHDVRPIGQKNIVTENNKRNTIREFSFSDSKMGYDINRTAKSTSAKGRYVKHSKERPRIEMEESSYEEFLRRRHSDNGSYDNADSDQESGEDSFLSKMYMRSQPNLHSLKDGKSSLWKKLTWRFRKHAAGYDMS